MPKSKRSSRRVEAIPMRPGISLHTRLPIGTPAHFIPGATLAMARRGAGMVPFVGPIDEAAIRDTARRAAAAVRRAGAANAKRVSAAASRGLAANSGGIKRLGAAASRSIARRGAGSGAVMRKKKAVTAMARRGAGSSAMAKKKKAMAMVRKSRATARPSGR